MTHSVLNKRSKGIKQVLVVDDNPDEVPKISKILKKSDQSIFVDWATSLSEARSKIARKTLFGNKYDLVIADMYLSKNEDFGADFLLECNRQYPVEKLLLMSNQSRQTAINDCNYARGFSFIQKNIPVKRFVTKLKSVLNPDYKSDVRAQSTSIYPSPRDFFTLIALTVIFFAITALVMIQVAKTPVVHDALDAPLIRILKQRNVQSRIDSLVNGGLTVSLKDPDFLKPKRISWTIEAPKKQI